ncbi:MAG: type IV pilus biogenesis/stability protein PilW [Pseudomonadota bacterium]
MNQYHCLKPMLLGLVVSASLSGCVTETSGGLPKPAAVEARIQAQLDLARGYIEQRNISRAKGPLSKALELNPGHVEARVLYAVLLESENEYELAEDNYRLALNRAPTDPQALNNFGRFLYGQQRYTEAVDVLRRLVADTGYHARAQAFENLGLSLVAIDDEDAAYAAFTRALELNFRQPRSNLELAALELAKGNYRAAQSQLISFRTYARQTARSLCLGIKVHDALDDADQVASNTLALKNLFPDQAVQCLTKI